MKKRNILKSGLKISGFLSGIFLMMILCISNSQAQQSPASDAAIDFGLQTGEQNIPPGGQMGTRASDYLIDDGSSESSVAISGGGDMMWLVPFDVIAGAEYIDNISLTWGNAAIPGIGPPNGAPTRVILYDDLNNDGNPSDAVYLTEAPTNVANVDLDIFTVVPIIPTLVSGKFFVAALYQNQPALPSPPGYYPASKDNTTSAGVAWWVGESTPGAFDVIILTNNGSPPVVPFPGNWLLRAHGTSSPFPPGVPLASIWIVIAAAGMGGAAFFKFRRK